MIKTETVIVDNADAPRYVVQMEKKGWDLVLGSHGGRGLRKLKFKRNDES